MKQVQYIDKKGNLEFSCLFYYSFMAKFFAKTIKLFGATRIEIVDTDMDRKEKTLADIFVEKYHDKLEQNLYDFQNEKNSRIKDFIITEIP